LRNELTTLVLVLCLSSNLAIGSKDLDKALVCDNQAINSEISPFVKQKITTWGLKRTHDIRYTRASWYGDDFHGRITANSEVYNKNSLTCAHKTLPLNSYLLVTNLENNKQVIVRVNDRGPYVIGREVDLSESAAKAIDSKKTGLAFIKYEVLYKA
jgi:rare lipoprotein A